MKRTRIYLDEDQAARLARRAQAHGAASSEVRAAVEKYLSSPDDELTELARQRQALAEAFGSAPRLPEGSAYVDEFRRSDAEREDDLEKRGRST
jgi:Arc/MetJ-type ribon-helix-helix transcriptional regulator